MLTLTHTYTHITHLHTFSCRSEHHRQLLEFLLQITAHSPSMQVNRKTPPTAKSESSTPATTPTAAKTELAWQEVDRSVHSVVTPPTAAKTELAWQEVDRSVHSVVTPPTAAKTELAWREVDRSVHSVVTPATTPTAAKTDCSS